MLAVVIAFLVSCEMEDKDTIALANDANRELYFSGEESSRSIVLVASTMWSAESDKKWCTVSPSEGLSTELKLTISVDRNDKDEERAALVTLRAGTAVLTVTVVQSEQSTLSVSEADYIVKAEGGVLKMTVSHNVDYKVKIPRSVGWIKETTSKSMSESEHIFEVEPNEDLDNRSVVITFVSEGGSSEEEVTVVQLRKDALVISDSRYVLEPYAGTLSFTVTSSDPVEVKIEEGAKWLKHVDSKAVETELFFSYEANASDMPRTARIKLTSGTATDYIEVEQQRSPDNLVFLIYHENTEFNLPVFNTGFTGTVYWGDDTSDIFGNVSSHEYVSDGEHQVMFDLYGNSEEFEFSITDLTGITGINLEKLR